MNKKYKNHTPNGLDRFLSPVGEGVAQFFHAHLEQKIMSKIKKPGNPSEVPKPDREPEIKPDIPEKPVLPEEEPEIQPEREPGEPSPAEIPVPKAKV